MTGVIDRIDVGEAMDRVVVEHMRTTLDMLRSLKPKNELHDPEDLKVIQSLKFLIDYYGG